MKDAKKNRPEVAGIGEVLWDIVEECETLGGAPVNFSYHAGQLGAKSWPISAVGRDERGKKALSVLQRQGIATDHISEIEGATTGYVKAELDQDGVASYTFPDDVAWDRLRLDNKTLALAGRLDAICFGSLAQRSEQSRAAIYQCIEAMRPDALKIFDLNIRQDFYSAGLIRDSLAQADILKLNDDELGLMAEQEELGVDQQQQMHQLLERYGLSLIVLTRGANGSLLMSPTDVSDHPGFETAVADTIGAGDSFTAATAVGMLKGYSLEKINEQAGRVAAYVCTQKGAMVRLPGELKKF